MSASTNRTASPSDFVILKSYKKDGKIITGEFPVYITTASLCCKDSLGNISSTPVGLPTNK